MIFSNLFSQCNSRHSNDISANKNFAYTKNIKGITLVALVVTIVVLLILAGVTIMMLFGENGIIKKAEKAKEETNQKTESDQEKFKNLIDQMNSALDGSGTGGGTGDGGSGGDGGDATPVEKGKTVPEDTKFKDYEDVPIPGGYCVVKDVTNSDGTTDENKVSTGLVISDVEDDDLNNSKYGNQFVWVPVNEAQFTKMYDATNKRGNLYKFGTYNYSASKYDTFETPELIPYSATGYREPDIVTYYDGSDATEASYFNEAISDPMTGAQFKTQLQNEFNSMIASVERYDGFYIGRYETGNLEENKTTIPVVQKGNEKIHSVNWYYMYANSQKIAKNSNVTSSMIWGCQFDRTLEWIAEMNPKSDGTPDYSLVTNSTSWGNYKDATFEYTDSAGATQTKAGNTSKLIPTGSSEHNKKNHIYDLAGNAWDLTLETSGSYGRVHRRRLLARFKFR